MKKLMVMTMSLLALAGCEQLQAMTGGNEKSAGKPSGPKQEIEIVTTPSGANCAIDRDNMTYDRPQNTPVKTHVVKDGKELTVRCIKSGYSQGSATLKPRADKTYSSPVTILLKKK